MDVNAVIAFLSYGIQLKQMPRTGWVQRGVPGAENVAAHSYGVVLTALTLAELVDEPLDLARLLALATLHDLPEALTSDIPSPVKRFFPQSIEASLKTDLERGAMREIVGEMPFGGAWMVLWEELHAAESAESRLTHDADKLDMFLQAYSYERQMGTRALAEFWTVPFTFAFAATQAVYDELRRRREHGEW
ncbi:MAG: HD domain-containing protein [Anaerolineae bacterium]|nr:HD domain-containing protein [Anaerolineae bacterium]